jgi:hypothetical protein
MRSFEVRAASSQHETGTGTRLVNPWFDWLLEVKPKNRKVRYVLKACHPADNKWRKDNDSKSAIDGGCCRQDDDC